MTNSKSGSELNFVNIGVLIIVILLVVFFIVKFNYSPQIIQSNVKVVDVKDSQTEIIIDPCASLLSQDAKKSCELKKEKCNSNECHLEKALFFKNEQECFEITDELTRASCSLVIIETKIFEKSVIENNVELCDELNSISRVENCYDNYYLSLKYNKDDMSSCNLIKNEVLRNECLS